MIRPRDGTPSLVRTCSPRRHREQYVALALADCLEARDAGVDVDAVLGRFPEHQTELRRLLDVVDLIARSLPRHSGL